MLAVLIVVQTRTWYAKHQKHIMAMREQTSKHVTMQRLDLGGADWRLEARSSYEVNAVRTDATGSAAVKHGSKVKPLELMTLYHHIKLEGCHPPPAIDQRNILFPDVLQVPVKCDGLIVRI